MYVYVPQTTPETTEKITETTNNPTSVSPTTGKNNQTTGKKINKPDKVKIISARNVKKKTVKLTWKKVSGKTKYQIQYSLNKKFRKGVKTKKTTKPNIKINRLSKRKNTMILELEAINSAGIGKWSNVKKIVIRK
ncbi:MAG: fibronectin type III domain-containing protein [Eubacterium ventriosum]